MIFNTYSKRRKAEKENVQEVYTYDEISSHLKTQIVHIWHDSIGDQNDNMSLTGQKAQSLYWCIVDVIRKEHGFFVLPPSSENMHINYLKELTDYFLQETDPDRVLDVIDISFRLIDEEVRKFNYQYKQDADRIANEAISDLNMRFQEHGVGYRFENKRIIRIDSEFMHAEVIKPVLKLLTKSEYAGAQDEFLRAHEHYRHGRKKDVLDDCLKSFESLMKSICSKRGWTYARNATASPLIKVCLDNKLIPPFFQSKMESLQSLLESGIPTVRNKGSGHGQGDKIVEVPDYMVAFALHETATVLLMLDQADAELNP